MARGQRTKRTFSKDELIFEEDQAGATMFIITAGKVVLTRRVEDGEQILDTLNKGDFFGEMAIISKRPRADSARALEDVELLELDGENLSQMIKTNMEISGRLIKRLAQRLNHAYDQIEALHRHDQTQRVINFLRSKQMEAELRDDRDLLAGMSDAELAQRVDLTEDQVSVVIDGLAEAGLVHRGLGGGYELPSKRNSEKFACFSESRAEHDDLTGVYNRHYLRDRLVAEVAHATRHQRRLSLLVLDIDRFKTIVETYGSSGGDLVLRQVAQAIQSNIRVDDVLTRFGGDRFVVICRDADEGQAVLLAERIRAEVGAGKFHIGRDDVRITVSIGVADLLMSKVVDAEALIDAAFQTLYGVEKTEDCVARFSASPKN